MNNIYDIEAEMEETEQHTEETLKEKEIVESREAQIKNAIDSLEQDARVAAALEKNESEIEQERENIELKIEDLKEQAESLKESLQEMIDGNAESAAVISQLAELGEDVSEALGILEQRQQLIDECTARLQAVLERLGMSGEFQEGHGDADSFRSHGADNPAEKMEQNEEGDDGKEPVNKIDVFAGDQNDNCKDNGGSSIDTEASDIPPLEDTQKRLKNSLGIGKAELNGFHPKVAQDMADALEDAKKDFPELNVSYIGSIQSQVRGIESKLIDFYRQYLSSIPNTGWSKELIDQAARLNASKFISTHKLDHTKGVFAWSWRIGNSDPSNGGLAEFNGVAVNLDYASDYDRFKKAKEQNVKDKFKPIGCDSPRATMDHELGHEIDRMLGASRDSKINEWYNEMMESGNAEELLSGYSRKNIAEFIAEAYSEYRNNPQPRDLSQKVYHRLLELKSLREGNKHG